MKKQEQIQKLVEKCEKYILADMLYSDMKGFPFYGEVNTHLTTVHGIRKILLWVLDQQPLHCRALSEDYKEEDE